MAENTSFLNASTNQDNLNLENHVLEGFYRDVMGEINADSRYINHWKVPMLNLHSEIPSLNIPLDCSFQYKISRPRPFLRPSNFKPPDLKLGDPFEASVKLKEKWSKKLKVLIDLARKSKKWAEKQEHQVQIGKVKKKSADKPVYTVNSYADVANHLSNDPYPGFSGNYNWLATGGALTHCSIDGQNHILYSSGKKLESLCVSCISQEEGNENFTSIHVPLSNNDTICQIVANSVETKGFACIRREKNCSVVRLKEGSSKPIVGRTLLEIKENDGMFTSIDMDPFEDSQFCTLDSSSVVKIWNLNTSSCVASGEIPTAESQNEDSSSWGYIKYSNTQQEVFALNRSSVFVKDQRMGLSQNSMEFSPRSIIDNCEDITFFLKSEKFPVVYVATSHQLLSLDLRKGWTQRWTHLMKLPPMYGTVWSDPMGEEEVVLLSSCIPDDTVAIVNKLKQGRLESNINPIGLPSMGDCLLLLNARGKCLSPNLLKRLEVSTTGMTVLASEDGNGFTALKSSSCGDVLSNQFWSKSRMSERCAMSMKDEIQADVEAWENWEETYNTVCCQANHDLACPTFSNNEIFDLARRALKQDKTKSATVTKWHETFTPSVKLNMHPKYPDIYADVLLELGTHTDALSEVLLQGWDDDGFTSRRNPTDYVQNWLGSMNESSGARKVEDNSSVSDFDTPSMASFNESFDASKCVGDDSVFKTPTAPIVRPKKKVKRESLGF